jgi:two-component system sensor histidine kinase KdpD
MHEDAMHNSMFDEAPAMRGVAMDALALQSALLASVSHDLRNPLSVILGASEVLHDGFDRLADEDRYSYLRSIRRECLRMDEYVQGVLHATRLLVGGTARLVRDWVGIDELAGSAVERLCRYRPDTRVSIDIRSPLQPMHVNGALVEQALLNVLDNAAKFSPAGAPVHMRIEQCGDANARIEVVDSGPGIAADQRERVFSMFVSDDPQSRGRAGAGLGLAISRTIVRAHGGDAVAEEPDHGTSGARVRLSLPGGRTAERSGR